MSNCIAVFSAYPGISAHTNQHNWKNLDTRLTPSGMEARSEGQRRSSALSRPLPWNRSIFFGV